MTGPQRRSTRLIPGAAYVEPAAATPDDAITAEIGWRDFFRDPLLQQLIGISLENNRDMRKAALNVEAAQALYRIQRAEMLPNLGVSARGASERVPADLSTTGQSDVLRRYDVAGVTAAWELDLWGRIRSLSDRALASYLALDETRIATQMSLVSEVASAYLTLRADQELLRLTSDTLATQKRSYGLTTQLVEAGNSTQLDLRRAEIALRTAEPTMPPTHGRRPGPQRAGAAVGPAADAGAVPAADEAMALPDDIVPTGLPSGLPSELLARRPDIRAAEQMLIGANANIGAARAAFFPTISLTGSAGTASASLDGLFDSGSRAWSFLPQITLPIFRGGAARQPGRGARTEAHRDRQLREVHPGGLRRGGRRPGGQARSMSRSARSSSWWRPARRPTSWPSSASRRAWTTTSLYSTRSARITARSRPWCARA